MPTDHSSESGDAGGLKNPIRRGPTGCARRCAREDLTTAKITHTAQQAVRKNPSASPPLAEGPWPPSRFRRPMLYPTELQARQALTIHQTSLAFIGLVTG